MSSIEYEFRDRLNILVYLKPISDDFLSFVNPNEFEQNLNF